MGVCELCGSCLIDAESVVMGDAFALRREACDGCAASRDELSFGPREAGEQDTGHERLREKYFHIWTAAEPRGLNRSSNPSLSGSPPDHDLDGRSS